MEDVLEDVPVAKEEKYANSKKIGTITIRYEKSVPSHFCNGLTPLNDSEQKERFFTRNLTPEFKFLASINRLESAMLKQTGNINFNLFREAKRIMDTVLKQFKSLDNFVEASFGPRITVEEATEKVISYINRESLPTPIEVIWCDELIGSALMASTKPESPNFNPNVRKFSMLLKSTVANTYLREQGILSLLDHELGTHYHRSYNEGQQVWYIKRSEFGLTPINSCELVKIEEGLACLHTAFHGKYPYLGVPAMLYYGSCMAEYLPFKDLYRHLSKYVRDDEQLWKHCMRIKRCLPSQDQTGGYGKDQRYFEGAVTVLREQANIDFVHLMSGKLTLEDIKQVQPFIIAENVRLPSFMRSMRNYRTHLRKMANMNGIAIRPKEEEPATPPSLVSVSTAPDAQASADNIGDEVATTISFSNPCSQNIENLANQVSQKMEPLAKKTTRCLVSRSLSKKQETTLDDLECKNAAAGLIANIRSNVKQTMNNLHFSPSCIEGDMIDLTSTGAIRRPTSDIPPLGKQKLDFSNKASNCCGCCLFTKGCLLPVDPEGDGEHLTPVILEIDMHKPVLNAPNVK